MPAYLIHIDPESGFTDGTAIAAYADNVGAIIEEFGGMYCVRHNRFSAYEGSLTPNYMTMIEFPSMARLEDFYGSAAYRPWLELRKRISFGNHLIVVES